MPPFHRQPYLDMFYVAYFGLVLSDQVACFLEKSGNTAVVVAVEEPKCFQCQCLKDVGSFEDLHII